MFNGIIYNQGVLKKISKTKKGFNIFIHSNLKLTKKKNWNVSMLRWSMSHSYFI